MTAGDLKRVLADVGDDTPVMIYLSDEYYTDYIVAERDGYLEDIGNYGWHMRSERQGLPVAVFLTPFTQMAP